MQPNPVQNLYGIELILSAREVSGLQTSPPAAECGCDAIPLPTPSRSRDGQFWTKVYLTDCCWLWTRAQFVTGYGAYWTNGKLVKAHRYAYEDAVGPIPEGRDLMHLCDVRLCVRPDHLRPATRRENQRDMVAKGRNRRQDGEYNHNAKLTWPIVDEIRRRVAAGAPQNVVARTFGTSPVNVHKIVNGQLWHPEEASAPEGDAA